MDDTEVADIGIQTALPMDLPDFEGRKPVGVVTRVNGAGERISRAMHYDEHVVLIIEGTIGNVGHGKTAQGMKRVQTITVDDLYEIEGRAGQRILNACRQAYRTADDARHNVPDLLKEHARQAGWKMSPDGWTDSTGRLLVAEELAEIRGTVIERAANDPSRDPVVLVLWDGSRRLWPGDMAEDAIKFRDERPNVGDQLVVDGTLLTIREVLDGATGEMLNVWTDEDEDARLAEMEREAMAREAAEDAEAFAELQRGRGLAPDGSPLEQIDPAGADDIDPDGPRFEEDDPWVGLPGPDGPIKPLATVPPDDELQVDDEPLEEPWDGYDKTTVEGIKNRVGQMTDRERVLEVGQYEAGHKNRKGVLEVTNRRAAEIFSNNVPREELPNEPTGFEVPTDAIEDEDDFEDLQAKTYAGGEPGGDDE